MIGIHYVLDDDGNPIPCEDFDVWATWFETANRTLAKDRDERGEIPIEVSTVFLGRNHNWGPGPPILWETMVFGGPLDGEMGRYTSRDEALTGHQRMCGLVNLSKGAE